jgi:CHAT domain-containing protein
VQVTADCVVVPSLVVAVLPEPAGATLREVTDLAESLSVSDADQDIADSIRMTVPASNVATAPPLVVGDPLGDLTAAGNEARDVAVILGTAAIVGPGATVSAVLDAVEGSTIVHIAAHATFNADDPMLSAIHLTDGDITVARLARSWANARVVVLSACEGASESVAMGGEILGLATALVRIGVDTVIANLWRADDSATAFLMTSFHELLAAGMPPAHALHEAEVATRAESGWDLPYYWAGFVLCDRGAAA